jgi:integrase
MAIMKLTQDGIAKLRCPDDKKSLQVCDADHRGLLLELRKSDPEHPTWYTRYKSRETGRTRYVRIGHFPDVSLSEARARAKDIQASIRLGSDPKAEEDARKAVPTFTDYMLQTFLPHVRTHLRTAGKYEEYFRLRLKPVFGHKRLNQIRRHDIQLFHTKLRQEGLAPATCNLYLRTLKTAFSRAIQAEIIPGPNPAVGIRQFRETPLENYLDDDQLQKLLTVLEADKNRVICDIILFLLSTAARRNEALQAQWEHIDVENRVWRIPATNSKSGKVRAVPLNDTALDILSRQNTRDKYEHVFVNKRTGKPYTTFQKVWERLRRKAGLEHVRCHDLRHTAASYMCQAGISLYTIQGVLGHSSPVVTQRYAHLSTKTLQDASDKVADAISNAMKKTA